MSEQWWEFWSFRESTLLGVMFVEFIVKCKACSEFFAVRSLLDLPDECPECKRKAERREL